MSVRLFFIRKWHHHGWVWVKREICKSATFKVSSNARDGRGSRVRLNNPAVEQWIL